MHHSPSHHSRMQRRVDEAELYRWDTNIGRKIIDTLAMLGIMTVEVAPVVARNIQDYGRELIKH